MKQALDTKTAPLMDAAVDCIQVRTVISKISLKIQLILLYIRRLN